MRLRWWLLGGAVATVAFFALRDDSKDLHLWTPGHAPLGMRVMHNGTRFIALRPTSSEPKAGAVDWQNLDIAESPTGGRG